MSDEETHQFETPFAKITASKGTRAATSAEVESDEASETSSTDDKKKTGP